MPFKNMLISIFVLILKINLLDCLEPISTTIGIGIGFSSVAYLSNIHCNVMECCNEAWIPANVKGTLEYLIFD